MAHPRTTLVVPCYNEAARLPAFAFAAFCAADPGQHLAFVDDGSTDGTRAVLDALAERVGPQVAVLTTGRNIGKAEAVRLGCRHALNAGSAHVGYWDADLATPLDAVAEFERVLDRQAGIDLVCGARVRLLGHRVERSPARHYLGRVFATAAAVALGLPVYDTQCGAKLFRNTPRTRWAFAAPFRSRWLLDIELLMRMAAWDRSGGPAAAPVADAVFEQPLREWRDVAGSKVKPWDLPKSLLELARLRRAYGRLKVSDAGRPTAEPATRRAA